MPGHTIPGRGHARSAAHPHVSASEGPRTPLLRGRPPQKECSSDGGDSKNGDPGRPWPVAVVAPLSARHAAEHARIKCSPCDRSPARAPSPSTHRRRLSTCLRHAGRRTLRRTGRPLGQPHSQASLLSLSSGPPSPPKPTPLQKHSIRFCTAVSTYPSMPSIPISNRSSSSIVSTG